MMMTGTLHHWKNSLRQFYNAGEKSTMPLISLRKRNCGSFIFRKLLKVQDLLSFDTDNKFEEIIFGYFQQLQI